MVAHLLTLFCSLVSLVSLCTVYLPLSYSFSVHFGLLAVLVVCLLCIPGTQLVCSFSCCFSVFSDV